MKTAPKVGICIYCCNSDIMLVSSTENKGLHILTNVNCNELVKVWVFATTKRPLNCGFAFAVQLFTA